MLKKENLRKNFLRVKQIADQNLGRAEKSEVLSEDLQSVEKRVELVRVVCASTTKKVSAGLQGTGPDMEKRMKKLPESQLAQNMIENANLLGTESIMGSMFQMCGECEYAIARHLLQYEYDIEKSVLQPLQEILDSEIPVISKAKKQLTKLTLDMDSARSRWNEAVKQTQVHGANVASKSAKADQVKEEYEESCNRMYMARDNLATEMFNFVAKEAEHSSKLLEILKVQKEYHRKALEEIEKIMPKMNEALECNPHKPVYGVPLEEHLRVTGRDIALVIEACICTLIEGGLDEEGLFRIAGMASKVKKLKNSFDANVVDMEDYIQDLHSVAGALKQYLRELPEPLLTTSLYPEFMKASQLPQDQKLQSLWSALRTIPDINYNNFRYLIKFLAKLAARSSENKMTPSNISIVIGPNLLWSEDDDGPNMVTSGTISNLIELIIVHADWFFPEEIEFRSLDSLELKSSLSDAVPVSHDVENPGSNRSSGTVSPNSSTNNLASMNNNGSGSLAPLAEDEDTSPKVQKRIPRKPAPPPPERPSHLPERPFSVAVTASYNKGQGDQALTWPRNATTPGKERISGSTEDVKPKSPTDKPSLPDKPGNAPQRSATMADRHSHHDRPSVPPPERPKIPPPAVPTHQRSASAGSASNINATLNPELTSKPLDSENEQGRLSSSSQSQVSQSTLGTSVLTPGMQTSQASGDQLSQNNRTHTQSKPVRPPVPKDVVTFNIETEQTRL